MDIKKIILNKKATQMPTENVIFIILNILFFSAMLFFVWRTTSDTSVVEENYAKKISLILDNMQPGMEINISAVTLFDILDKNKFNDFPIIIKNNSITVIGIKNGGYSFRFFSNLNPVISTDKKAKIITIKT